MTASPGPACGRGTSRTSILFGATKTFARIVPVLASVKETARSGVVVVAMETSSVLAIARDVEAYDRTRARTVGHAGA
jgi:hypothetical protein